MLQDVRSKVHDLILQNYFFDLMRTFFYEWLTAGSFKAFNVLFLSSNKFKVLQILLLLMKMASLKAKVAEQSIFQDEEQKISQKSAQKSHISILIQNV